MLKYHHLLVAGLLCITAVWANPTVEIREERGVYQLNFESTYESYIHNDIEMCVTLPKGYMITAVMPGSPDFLSVAVLQNRLYISKATPDNGMLTNLSVHVRTDEGLERELFFKLKSVRNAPKVLAIQFEKPNYSELNATVEAVKNRYNEQLNATLADQQREVTKAAKATTMMNCRPWFIKSKHGGVKTGNKGATARLMGLINFDGSSYVYIEGLARDGDCDVITLEAVEVEGQKHMAELLGGTEIDDGPLSMLVYQIPEIQFKKKKGKYKNRKFKLHLRIWSELHTAKFKAQ